MTAHAMTEPAPNLDDYQIVFSFRGITAGDPVYVQQSRNGIAYRLVVGMITSWRGPWGTPNASIAIRMPNGVLEVIYPWSNPVDDSKVGWLEPKKFNVVLTARDLALLFPILERHSREDVAALTRRIKRQVEKQ